MKRIKIDNPCKGCEDQLPCERCIAKINYDIRVEAAQSQLKADRKVLKEAERATQMLLDITNERVKDKITPEEAIFLLCGIGVDSGCSKCPNETLCCSNKTEIIYKNIEAKLKSIIGGKK